MIPGAGKVGHAIKYVSDGVGATISDVSADVHGKYSKGGKADVYTAYKSGKVGKEYGKAYPGDKEGAYTAAASASATGSYELSYGHKSHGKKGSCKCSCSKGKGADCKDLKKEVTETVGETGKAVTGVVSKALKDVPGGSEISDTTGNMISGISDIVGSF
jgi:hypothetical protein